MTLQEAINIKNGRFGQDTIINDAEYREATYLSIEALKWYEKHRPIYPPASLHLLPGETED